MNAALLEDIDQLESLGAQPPFSFAYPCGITWVGNDQQSYVDLVRQHFIGARGVVGLLNGADANLYETYARSARPDPALTISWIDEALAEGKWAVVLFHTVEGVYQDSHSAIVRYLADHRDRIWTAPFRDIVRCVRAARGSGG